MDMDDLPRAGGHAADDEALPEPAPIRRMRRLVTALLVVMILGMVVVSAALVSRLGVVMGGVAAPAGPGPLPEAVALPAAAEIVAVGRAGGDLLIVTREADGAEHIRAFDAATGAPGPVTRVERR